MLHSAHPIATAIPIGGKQRRKGSAFSRVGNMVCNLCLYAFLVLTVVLFLFQFAHAIFLLRMGILVLGAGACILVHAGTFSKCAPQVLLSLALVSCWLVCSWGYGSENFAPSNLLYTICYIWLSLVLLKNTYSHLIAILILGFGMGTVALRAIQGVSFTSILLATSQNYISVLLITLVLFYYASCHDKCLKPSLIPAASLLPISIFATGRGGILSSGFLVVSLAFFRFRGIKNRAFRWCAWFLLTGAAAFILVYMTGPGQAAFNNFLRANFSRFYLKGNLDEARAHIWLRFLENNMESVGAFLFGSDTSLVRFDGNLHNSFLQAYAAFGLTGFLIVVVLTIRAYVDGIRHKDALWLILFSTLLLRASTDVVFFQGYCEPFLYYFVFYWKYHGNKIPSASWSSPYDLR